MRKQGAGGMRRIAIDTNVLLRFLLADGSPQSKAAVELARTTRPYVTRTVLLETEWVLRSVVGMPADAINFHFQNLLETREVDIEGQDEVALALEAHRFGMDLADALHLFGSSDHADAFATFDKALLKVARAKYPHLPVILCGED